MELIGTLKKIGEIQTFASGFQKREIVLVTEEQYPQPILIELLSNNMDIVNNFKLNDRVKIGINIRGREWVNQNGSTIYFNTITGWRIEKVN